MSGGAGSGWSYAACLVRKWHPRSHKKKPTDRGRGVTRGNREGNGGTKRETTGLRVRMELREGGGVGEAV